MASGNFLIGERLTLKGFDEYVKPLLEKNGYFIKDIFVVSTGIVDRSGSSILTSIVGVGNLEKGINESLIESGKTIEETAVKMRTESHGSYTPFAWQHQVSTFSWVKVDGKNVGIYNGHFRTLGVYDSDSTASQLFPSIAQNYLLDELETKTTHLTRQIKNLLGKKLSEI